MEFRQVGNSAVRLSRVALGGHEYLPSGHSRGFNEDFAKAITPGHSFPGFGGDRRKAVLAAAYDHGVNVFDVTLDAEKEALGRNLAEMPPPYDVYVQTRPEAMNYSYDPGNRKMTDLALLRAEVQRILKILRRDRLEILNLGPMRTAIEGDPDFVAKVAANVRALQREGLILFAAADTFSGQAIYEALVASGAFATLNINFNIADDEPARTIFPLAHKKGVHVTVREAFIKGALFGFGRGLGLDDAIVARVVDGHYWCIPKGVPQDQVDIIVDLMKFMWKPDQQALTWAAFIGPVVKAATIVSAPKNIQDDVKEFWRPEYDQIGTKWKVSPPLGVKELSYAMDRWDREIGADQVKK
ncbi:MAG: aldo/keto reductase [Rhizobiales bacterium]|nr:aldo/keto reductase [Hyphomicrobiales bacterium]